jgi:acetolactate synthase regulatory subunit
MSTRNLTVLVVLRDGPHALGRLLAICHRRGWAPVALRSTSDGRSTEVAMRLATQRDRRGTPAQVRAQLRRLVDVERLVLDDAGEVPDEVAFGAVRARR